MRAMHSCKSWFLNIFSKIFFINLTGPYEVQNHISMAYKQKKHRTIINCCIHSTQVRLNMNRMYRGNRPILSIFKIFPNFLQDNFTNKIHFSYLSGSVPSVFFFLELLGNSFSPKVITSYTGINLLHII